MKTPYTYTILRYVHDTMTGEFINVGVALLAPAERYASIVCRTTYSRLAKTFPGMNGDSFRSLMRFIQARFEEIGDRLRNELPLEELPSTVLGLAHTVLPADDSSLQWSPAGSGLTANPSETLEQLFGRMVSTYDERPSRESRTDEEIWRKFRRDFESRHLLKHFQPKTIAVQDDEIQFQYAWKNGVWHCLEPISFDLAQAESIRDKAHKWLGQIMSVKDAGEKFKLYLLLGQPFRPELRAAYNGAVSILRKIPVENEIVHEDEAAEFSARFASEIESHEHPTG